MFSFYLEGKENNQKEEIRMLSTRFLNFTFVSNEFYMLSLKYLRVFYSDPLLFPFYCMYIINKRSFEKDFFLMNIDIGICLKD
jgi:hypothetical protein